MHSEKSTVAVFMLRCTHIKWMRYHKSFDKIHFINFNDFFVVYIKPLMNKLAIPLNIKHNFFENFDIELNVVILVVSQLLTDWRCS